MSNVTIEKNGWKITASTLDALKLGIRAVEEAESEMTNEAAPSASSLSLIELEKALNFLLLLEGDKRGEVDVSDLVKKLGLKNDRAVGNVIVVTKKVLAALGVEDKDAYTSVKTGDNKRKWFPGNEVSTAINAIRAEMALREL